MRWTVMGPLFGFAVHLVNEVDRWRAGEIVAMKNILWEVRPRVAMARARVGKAGR